jgi:hypothetical protein
VDTTQGEGATPSELTNGAKSPDFQPISMVPAESTLQRPHCAHVSSTGASCGAFAVKDSAFCFYHDPRPEAIAKRERSRAKGNKKSNTHDGLADWSSHPIETMKELHGALSELFNAGMAGDITTNRLTALSSVANALMKSIEGSGLEARIAALEEKAEVRK